MKVTSGEILGQEKWDEFIKNNSSDFGLLQSGYWEKFQNSLNRKTFRLAIVDESESILAAVLIVKQPLKFGKNYFYIPRGPVVAVIATPPLAGEQPQAIMDDTGSPRRPAGIPRDDILKSLFSEIKNLAKREDVIFLRLDPAWDERQKEILEKLKLKFSGQVQPRQTLILDLTKSEEELLKAMKPKTRYNIKVAQKHCVQIDEGEKYFEDFWQLMTKTAKRDQISVHSKDYYRKMLEILGAAGSMKLIVARHSDRAIAANLVAYFGEWCVYLHGASDYEYRDKMAPYLLQWETVLDAKAKGLKFYDFWGADEAKWPGVTRFKVGFAPQNELTKYVGSWDQVYQKGWYSMYNLVKRLKF